MEKELALLKIERLIEDAQNDFQRGQAFGFISACFQMGLIDLDQVSDFQLRVVKAMGIVL